tara:strand:+ start:2254 stop:2433 length:180 start_codon:yes stop_codon:yes gene_type:complete
LSDEWVIKLINAADKAVKGYEKYLLDQLNFRELAKIMADLRELLPPSCKTTDEKQDKKK